MIIACAGDSALPSGPQARPPQPHLIGHTRMHVTVANAFSAHYNRCNIPQHFERPRSASCKTIGQPRGTA